MEFQTFSWYVLVFFKVQISPYTCRENQNKKLVSFLLGYIAHVCLQINSNMHLHVQQKAVTVWMEPEVFNRATLDLSEYYLRNIWRLFLSRVTGKTQKKIHANRANWYNNAKGNLINTMQFLLSLICILEHFLTMYITWLHVAWNNMAHISEKQMFIYPLP